MICRGVRLRDKGHRLITLTRYTVDQVFDHISKNPSLFLTAFQRRYFRSLCPKKECFIRCTIAFVFLRWNTIRGLLPLHAKVAVNTKLFMFSKSIGKTRFEWATPSEHTPGNKSHSASGHLSQVGF
jgi:hypothetical protein